MKNSDIALVILIAAMSFGIAYFVLGAIIGNPSEKFEKIDYIQDISSTIEEPDHETFNAYALNLNEEVKSGRCGYGKVELNGVCVDESKAKEIQNEINPEGDNTESEEPVEQEESEE
jgi:hypothetical protein